MTRTKLNSYARWVLAAVSGLAVVVALVGARAAGAAAPKCFGKKPTIVAGKKEKVTGTRKVDVIYAAEGRSHGQGRQGRRPGLHRVGASPMSTGDEGDDRIRATPPRDDIDGGAGDDLIEGGAGRNYLDGGVGDDRVIGGDDRDYVDGDDGDDRLKGAAGNDWLDGGDDNDNLDGGDETTA